MARSVTEILPRPFLELTLDDVAQIVADHREEGETLFFERKAEVSGNSLAKACSAFGNTLGGLLVVGVADDDGALVEIEPRASEAQLWVKDTLRGLVLPMPPFRARWMETNGDRGLLVVLVEESSTTPHLLTRSGAIYVRSPGSSDPVPIADQRRLLDLTARGERAVAAATSNALAALDVRVFDDDFYSRTDASEILSVAATGITANFESRIFDEGTPEAISVTTWGEKSDDVRRQEGRWSAWRQHLVGVQRKRDTPIAHTYKAIEESAALLRSGVALMTRGFVSRGDHRNWKDSRQDTELRAWFGERFAAAKDLLLDHGAHGDLRLVYKLDLSNTTGIYFEAIANVGAFHRDEPIVIEIDTTFDDETAEARVFAELLRVTGRGPTGK
jgi:hypothetical protein